MYIILVLAVVLISLTLAILSSRKLILDKQKNEATNTIYEVYSLTYRQALNTLKEEAIVYASENNIEKDSIKISDFPTSIDANTISAYKLSEKYLTMVSNVDTYNVYLGEEEIITNISKSVDNLIDIVDYKIYGNSVQNGVPTLDAPVEIQSLGEKSRNLADQKNVVKWNYQEYPESTDEGYVLDNSISRISFIPCKFESGKTYIINFKQERISGTQEVSVYLPQVEQYVSINRSFVARGDSDYLGIYVQNDSTGVNDLDQIKISEVMVTEGPTQYPYEPYGKYKIPITVGGKNLLDMSKAKGGTSAGVTAVLNEDGSLSTSGIATDFVVNIWLLGSYYNQTPLFYLPIGEYYVNDCRLFYYNGEAHRSIWGNIKITKEEFPNGFPVTAVRFEQTTIGYEYNGLTRYPSIERGDTLTEYEPYIDSFTTNIYLTEPLRKIGQYMDYIDFKKQNIVKNVEVINDTGTLTIEESLEGLLTSIKKTQELPKLVSSNYFTIISIDSEVKPSYYEFTVIRKLKQL